MNIIDIVNNIGKYHYLISSPTKTLLLSSNNSKTQARKDASEKLQPNIDKFIGKTMYLLTLKKVPKKDIKTNEKSVIKLIGGPIVAIIDTILIKKNTFKNEGGIGNNKIYFSLKYLNNNNNITNTIIKKITSDYHHKKLKSGALDINIL